ncbi:MAG: hypothetical protein KF797_14665, partial [Flavobacteriales bacterium]|nr:hypothetical protein [Flavobacteriales bacterium]
MSFHITSAFIIACLHAFGTAYGQSGPAGIGSSSSNVLWLRADEGVHATTTGTPAVNNGDVAQWSDRSGNGRNAVQATTANRPNYITNAVNGKPAIRFTKTSGDHFTTSGITSANVGAVLVVARYSSLPSSNPGLLQGTVAGDVLSSDPARKNIGMWVSSSSQVWGRGIEAGGTSRNVPATTTLSANSWYVLCANYDGSNITQYVDNAAAGAVAY